MGRAEEVSMTQTHTSAAVGTSRSMPISLIQVAAVSAVAGLVLGCLFAALAVAFGASATWIVAGITACSVIVSGTAVVSEVTVRASQG
jgi:hypothetical protein